jgi:mRNA interferase RelE/StbE
VAYHIDVTPAALRDLRALPAAILRRVDARILALAEEPRPPGAEKLTDANDLCRVRVGAYRILYAVDDRRQVVTVARVRHRRDVYRR